MKTEAAALPRPLSRPDGHAVPVAVICLAILLIWYVACIPMNAVVTEAKIEAAGGGLYNTLAISWSHDRPVIPAPHQIVAELWKSIFTVAPWKVRSLVYHAWITLSSTLVGFALGTLLGVGLAIAIVHSKFLSKSLMPWIVASQTIPILAIAPMVIVVLGAIGFTGLIPKSLISMYLCFFPVTIGMVKGLTSPEAMQLDLMRTYNAGASQVLWKLRFPASVPFLFASLKVAVAIALDRRHCRRVADGCCCRHWRAVAERVLLRPDGANLGGAVCGLLRGGGAGVGCRLGREGHRPCHGRQTMSKWTYRDILYPALFGLSVLIVWQLIVRGFNVSPVLLPAPSDIWAKLITSLPILWVDFVQTFLRAVIPGWIIGSLSGFLVAILCDRVPFLRRGLLPLGNLVAALPIVGVAPILVMWFGFDWQSKAAMVVVMTFFPMLINTVAGLTASGHLERDLMQSYGASWWQTLLKLRLPAAMPFVFNALKINSTLALIGAIVAEFFGTPIVGMGFRISTEVGRLGLDMVWAEIAMAAVAGSTFYGLLTLLERKVTFWHPSYRK